MSDEERRTFSLSEDLVAFIDRQVDAGKFAEGREVVETALRDLKERDDAMERWLHDEVAPTYDAMMADPSRGLSADDVFGDLRRRHAAGMKGVA